MTKYIASICSQYIHLQVAIAIVKASLYYATTSYQTSIPLNSSLIWTQCRKYICDALCLGHVYYFGVSYYYLLHVSHRVSYMKTTDTHKQTQVPSSCIMFPLSKDLVNKSITLLTDLVSQPRLANITQ